MDPSRFDRLARSLARPASRRDALGVLGGALALLGPASGRAQNRPRQQHAHRHVGADQPKVPVCHKGKTLLLPYPAVPAHLDHGDTLGSCGTSLTQPPPPTGGCTPLLQICWPTWLGGNPCCDANAECHYVNGDVPAFFCLDANKAGCTSDTECRARFTDRNIACLQRFPATCLPGVTTCCQRKLCPTGFECGAGAVCCNSGATLLQNACCSANQTQICNTVTGCVTP
jgi:hypothetical protein